MPKVTYKSLFTLVDEQINSRLTFQTSSRFKEQLSRGGDIAPFVMSSNTRIDVSVNELVSAVQDLLNEALPSRILSGLEVTQTNPISNKIDVSSGSGTAAGNLYTLEDDVTLTIPFDDSTSLYYVCLSRGAITLERFEDSRLLVLAKIVVPIPGVTNRVINNANGSDDAYIVQFREYKLFGDANGKFEEDTKELLKNNIGDILADTIVGNLKLSETLKITNTTGTMEFDSTSMKLKDFDGNILSKFNQNGVFFYNTSGVELAKFSNTGARVGNIVINKNSLESGNFISGWQGFRIKDDGNAEFNDIVVRGTIFANSGVIGGFTILPTKMYGGRIQTGETVAEGSSGVIMDSAGLRGYDTILGQTFNLPTNGDAPTFSSGIIREVIWEITTNSVMRTSETVGDGTSNSYGILINNTGIYGCGANQTLVEANLKALIDGTVRLRGEIEATSGSIGSVTITETALSGGLIEGSTLRAATIETSASVPRVRIDTDGLYFQTTTDVGKYGSSGSGSMGFKYGSGTLYGAGVTAYLFNDNFPIIAIVQERTLADIRLYNRSAAPTSGTHQVGDLICVSGKLRICTTAGTPGTFTIVGTQTA